MKKGKNNSQFLSETEYRRDVLFPQARHVLWYNDRKRKEKKDAETQREKSTGLLDRNTFKNKKRNTW